MGRAHPLLRLALLVAVTFGVFGMHTFGHPAGPDATQASAAHVGVAHAAGTADEIAAAPGAAHGEDDSPGHRDGMHAFTVCLAVLGGVLVLGALSLLCRPRRGTGTPTGPRSRGPGPRGPPRPPIGLRLRAATVLRT
ncbi:MULTISPECIES: DUF6153 family protein [Micromonospora]|uniref:DUF6153 family protein n=1 Tax=Micromonospora TaxID=1873 RepID=UPI000E07BA01|nr:DUF6153 family protein [Micromonospora provocatoris]RBJ11624.1 hypothetical protein DRA43_00415 [Micromonospora provocatoris]